MASRAPFYAELSDSQIIAVPESRTLSHVADALATLLWRYEGFRTAYSFAADGTPQQVVFSDGVMSVHTRDVDFTVAAESANAARDEFNSLPFTIPEFALRAAVITSDGIPRYVVLSAFRMAMDCYSMVAILEDFQTLLSGRSPGRIDSRSTTPTHPADRALDESTPESVQRSTNAVSFWEKEVARFPDDALPLSARRPANPRHQTFAMHSHAMRLASLQIARELSVTPASVVLAMAVSQLALRNGSNNFGLVLAASHRYDAESMQYAGPLVQGVPLALEVAADSSYELISRCHRASMFAALSGQCHPNDVDRMLHTSFDSTSLEAKLSCVMNINLPSPPDFAEDSSHSNVEEMKAMSATSRYEYVEGTPVENERFYLAAHGDETDFFVTARADTAVFTPPEIVEFLHNLERAVLNCLPQQTKF